MFTLAMLGRLPLERRMLARPAEVRRRPEPWEEAGFQRLGDVYSRERDESLPKSQGLITMYEGLMALMYGPVKVFEWGKMFDGQEVPTVTRRTVRRTAGTMFEVMYSGVGDA